MQGIISLVIALAPVSAGNVDLEVGPLGSGEGRLSRPAIVRLKALKREVDDAKAVFERASSDEMNRRSQKELEKLWNAYLQRLDVNVSTILGILSTEPKSEMAVSLLEWIIIEHGKLGKQAVELLRDHHVRSSGVGFLCTHLGVFGNHQEMVQTSFLDAVARENPDRIIRGQALLALARRTLKGASDLNDNKDRKRLVESAVRLFEDVIKSYSDCPYLPIRETTLGVKAKAALFEIRLLQVGNVAPDIQGKDLEGKDFKLSDYRGRVVVLSFWVSWCESCSPVCQHEQSLMHRLKDRPFVVIGVNSDKNGEELNAFLKENKVGWRSFWDKDAGLTEAWNVRAWPTLYVLDHEGVIRFKQVFFNKLEEAVDQLLKEMEKGK